MSQPSKQTSQEVAPMVDQIRMMQEFIHKVFNSEILSGFLGTVPVEDCQVCNHAHHEDYLVDKRYLEIELRILRIPKLRANLEIAHWVYAISRLRGTSAQSRDSTISVACTIEPFEFPSYTKVRDVCNKLLQLHVNLRALLDILTSVCIKLITCI